MLNRMGSHWLTIGHGEPLRPYPAGNSKLNYRRRSVLISKLELRDGFLRDARQFLKLLLRQLGDVFPRVAKSFSEIHDENLHA